MNTSITPTRYVNPMIDVAFKYLFGTEKNKPLLKGLLEHVFGKKIRDITYDNNEKIGESPEERNAYFDVVCQSADGPDFIVECQVQPQQHFAERAVFYCARAIARQAPKGEWDYHFRPVYFLAFIDFPLPLSAGRSAGYVHRFSTRNEETGILMTDKLRYIFMEVGPFRLKKEECHTFEERFLFYMKNLPTFAEEPETQNDEYFEELLKAAEYFNMDKETQEMYERRLKRLRDSKNVEDYMKMTARNEGLAEGREEGKIEGLAEGLTKGKIEVAHNMLKKGFDPKDICELTGLSAEEVSAL